MPIRIDDLFDEPKTSVPDITPPPATKRFSASSLFDEAPVPKVTTPKVTTPKPLSADDLFRDAVPKTAKPTEPPKPPQPVTIFGKTADQLDPFAQLRKEVPEAQSVLAPVQKRETPPRAGFAQMLRSPDQNAWHAAQAESDRLKAKHEEEAFNADVALASLKDPAEGVRMIARRMGKPEEEVQAYGRPNAGGNIVTGFPTPTREIPVSEDPELTFRQQSIDAKYIPEDFTKRTPFAALKPTGEHLFGKDESRAEKWGTGIGPRNPDGTAGPHYALETAGWDYNPVALAVGAGGALLRQLKRDAPGALDVPKGSVFDKLMPSPSDLAEQEYRSNKGPMANLGRFVADAPAATIGLLDEKYQAAKKVYQEGGAEALGAHIIGADEPGMGITGPSQQSSYDGSAFDALVEGVQALPGEVYELGASTAQLGLQGLKAFQGSISDQPAAETLRPVVNTATGMASGAINDLIRLGADPKDLLRQGLLRTLMTVMPVTEATRAALGVEKMGLSAEAALKEAQRLADTWEVERRVGGTDADPVFERRPLKELTLEQQKLSGARRGAVTDVQDAELAAKQAAFKEAEPRARGFVGPDDPVTNDIMRHQRIAREVEAVAAREKLAAATDAEAAFNKAYKPAIDEALRGVDAAFEKARSLANKTQFVKFVSELPTHYATLGASAIADLAGIAIMRGFDVPAMLARVGVKAPEMMKNWKVRGLADAGAGGARYAVMKRSARLPWLDPLERELGREPSSQIVRAQEAFRAIPDALKPDVSMGLHLEASIQEGGYYNPGLDRSLNIMDYSKDAGWHYTPFGEKVRGAYVKAAKDGSIEAADWLQKADSHLDVVNRYANPLADISHELTAKEIRVGLITPFDKEAHIAQRIENVNQAKMDFVREAVKVDRRYKMEVQRAARAVGVQSTALDKIAGTAQRILKTRRERDVSGLFKNVDRATAKAEAVIKRAFEKKKADIEKSLAESKSARTPEAQAEASRAHNARVKAINAAYDRATKKAIETIARRQRDIDEMAKSGGKRVEAKAQKLTERIAKEGDREVARAERARDKAIWESLEEVERAHTPEAYQAAARAHAKNVAAANDAYEAVVFSEERVLQGLKRKATNTAIKTGQKYAADAGILARTQNQLLTGAVTRADRIVQRAKSQRDSALGRAAADLEEQTHLILSEPIPHGLRPVQWRQVYDKGDVKSRLQERAPSEPQGEFATQASLAPNAELPHIRENTMRRIGASITRRKEEYGMKPVLADEVVALQERAKDASKYELFQRLSQEHALTPEQLDMRVAQERALVQAQRERMGLPRLTDEQLAIERVPAQDAFIWVSDEAKFDGMDPGMSPKKYGDLAGKYIPEDLWFELRNAENIAVESAGAFNKALSMVKFGKTALSPVTTARNIISSALLFAPMAGISLLNPKNWGYFWDALKDMVGKEKSAAYHMENAAGIGTGTMVDTEMALRILDDMHSGFIGHVTGPIRGFMQGAAELMTSTLKFMTPSEWRAMNSEKANLRKLSEGSQAGGQRGWDEVRFKPGVDGKPEMVRPTAWKGMKQGFSKITDATRQAFISNPGAFYSAQDILFKRALSRKLIAEGMAPEMAYARAQEAFVNYADVPGFVQLVRNMHAPIWSRERGGIPSPGGRLAFFVAGQPFFAFTAKAIPMAFDWATKNPAQSLIYAHLYDTISRQNLIESGMTPESARAAIRSGSQWEQGKRLLAELIPGLARDPVSGDLRRIDANYLSLMGDLFAKQTEPTNEVARRIAVINQILNVGPGMLAGPLFDVMNNYDSFRRRDITPAAASPEAAFAAIGNFLIRALLPPITPSPSDIWRGSIDIDDPTRIGGGSAYDQVAAAAAGKRDYAGNMRTVGEAITGLLTGTKADRASLKDNVLNHMYALAAVDQSAMNEAVKASGQANRLSDPEISGDAEKRVGAEYFKLLRPHLEETKKIIDGLAWGELRGDGDTMDVSDRIAEAISLGDDGDFAGFGEVMDSLLGDAVKKAGERARDRRNLLSPPKPVLPESMSKQLPAWTRS